MNLENMLSVRNLLQKISFGGQWVVTANEYNISFRGDENVSKLIVVMVAQLCDYPKNYPVLHFKNGWVLWFMNYISINLLFKET